MRRRDFLKAAAAAPALAARRIRLGIRTVVYRSHNMAEAARRIRAAGFEHVQLGLRFADARLDLAAPDWSYARRAREVFAAAGVRIAGWDGYVSLVTADAARRKENISGLARLLEHARELGSPIVATETGSFHAGARQ